MKFNKQQMLVVTLFIVTGLLLAACGTPQPQTFTVGVVNLTPTLNPTFDGFMAGMAELGYVEGENVTYIYEGPVGAIDALEPAVQKLMEAEPDLVLSISTPATLRAKAALEGTDIPLVFSPVNDPVGSGVVDSLRNPGGNLTGPSIYTGQRVLSVAAADKPPGSRVAPEVLAGPLPLVVGGEHYPQLPGLFTEYAFYLFRADEVVRWRWVGDPGLRLFLDAQPDLAQPG